VNRMRTVNEMKQRQKEMEENEWKVEDEKYKKSREMSKKGFVPFELNAEKRFNDRKDAQGNVKKKKPKLIVEVRLSKTRMVKIKISDGDNPRSVAARFGKIYSLDGSAIVFDILTAVVRESMLSNNVNITERSSSPSSTTNDGRSSGKVTRQSISTRTEVDYSESRNSEWGPNNFSSRDIEEETLSVYSYFDDETIYYNDDEDDDNNNAMNNNNPINSPSSGPITNRRRQSLGSNDNNNLNRSNNQLIGTATNRGYETHHGNQQNHTIRKTISNDIVGKLGQGGDRNLSDDDDVSMGSERGISRFDNRPVI